MNGGPEHSAHQAPLAHKGGRMNVSTSSTRMNGVRGARDVEIAFCEVMCSFILRFVRIRLNN